MQKLRERFENIQQEQQEVEKAFDLITKISAGQFTHDGKDIYYHGDSEHYKHMLQEFESVKPILFYTRNNKWLVMEYLAKHDESNSLSQLISILLGYQGQDAIDSNDVALEDKLHIESCIWSSIHVRAKYMFAKAN